MKLIDPTKQRVRPIRHDHTGKIIGLNTDHWSGRTDALIRPPVVRPMGLMRGAIVNSDRRCRQVSGGAITASGVYIPTLRDVLDVTQLAVNVATDVFDVRVIDISPEPTPNFDTHTQWSDISGSEITGTGYTAGGHALVAFTMAITAGALTFDATDDTWPTSTLTDAMAAVWVDDTIVTPVDPLLFLFDFVTAVSTVAGTLTVQYGAPAVSIDLTP